MNVNIREGFGRKEVQQVREPEEFATSLSQVASWPILEGVFEAEGFECRVSIDYLLWLLSLALKVSLGSLLLRLCLFLTQIVQCLLNASLESGATMPRHLSYGICDF